MTAANDGPESGMPVRNTKICTARAALAAFLARVLLFVSVCFCSPVSAQNWDDAAAALDRGDYDRAFSEFWSLAGQGHAVAQYYLGEFYYFGLGVQENHAAAARWYLLAADQGDADAQFSLGLMYGSGKGVREDPREAARWYRLAADQGHADAQFLLGMVYSLGEGVRENTREAARWYQLAADQGHADAQYNLGMVYSLGEGVREDNEAAARWFRLAAGQGHTDAQYYLGEFYYFGQGGREDFREAARWYRLAADQGHADAQFSLGIMHDSGEGVRADRSAAVRWYRLAAEQGHANAQFNLGISLLFGEGVRKDPKEAAYWHRLSADQGHADAQFSLGLMHDSGEGVREDRSAAVRWYRLAAEQGHIAAQFNLGVSYHFGKGVRENHAEAARWFRLAAEQGDADAQFLLAKHYELGTGMPRNLVLAYMWYSLAAAVASSLEDPDSLVHEISEIESSRNRVAGHLSYQEQSNALDMAREWRPAVLTPDPSPQFDNDNSSSSETAREIQRSLRQLGYYSGEIDGLAGPNTRAAIRSFQADVGLPVDGAISEQLENALVVASRLIAANALQANPKVLELTATGSGFRVSPHGHVLTNDHVVSGCAEVRIPPYGSVPIIARDEASDLAILKAPRGGAVASFRQGQGVQQGAEVLTAGFPHHGLLASGVHVTVGMVSALAGPLNDRRQIQITAPIQPGNSGGPVVDTSGNAIGVVVARFEPSDFQTVNFAVSAGTARAFLDSEGVEYVTAPSNVRMEREAVAAVARAFTVLVECWD